MRWYLAVTLLSTGLFTVSEVPAASPQRVATGLSVGKLDVRAEIKDGLATTEVRQTISNSTSGQVEAIWVLPLPEGAVADRFEMTTNGVTMKGEVFEADRARDIYESIVRRRRDPGLLEYIERGLVRVRVYPIPPRGKTEVVVGFRQVLPELSEIMRWSLALNAAGLDGAPATEVSVDVKVTSQRTLANVFSPHTGFDIYRSGAHEARISFEGKRSELASGEIEILLGYSEHEFGMNLLTHRVKAGEEGTFALLLSPRRTEADKRVLRKSIQFVLDTSGSMRGVKIDQAKRAIRLFLNSLNEDDRFNVVTFSTEARPFFEQPVSPSWAHMVEALNKVERIRARGGTNIEGALRAGFDHALDDSGRVPLTVFLTDGLPSVGTRSTKRLLEQVRDQAEGTRLFVFGVGSDVNTALLDGFAEITGGRRNYVSESEGIELKTGALFDLLSHPVLTDLELEIEGVSTLAMVPGTLPNLYLGESLKIFGRFEGEGPAVLHLKGSSGNEAREFTFETTFAGEASSSNDMLPVLWAERRVGQLLDELRLHGDSPELTEEITRLGRQYNIVTPFTSHLILEEGMRPRTSQGGGRRSVGGGGGGPAGPAAGPSGPAAPGPRGAPGAAPVTSGGRGGAYRGPGDTNPPSSTDGSDGFFLGRGQGQSARQQDLLEKRTRDWLVGMGVLPKDATEAELDALARQVAAELRRSRDRMDKLGSRVSGEGAVADSRYLDLLVREGQKKDVSLIQLFSRRAGDKLFLLREGIWTDRSFDPDAKPVKERVRIEAYSKQHFALLRERPGIAKYLALSDRLLVDLGDRVYEFHPPAPPKSKSPTASEGDE